MAKREKKLEKQKESLLQRAEEHRLKAEIMRGNKDTTRAYWLGEAERFEQQARERQGILEKLNRKKKF